MLESPATRYGYPRSGRDDWGETEWGPEYIGLAWELPILKRGKVEPNQPCSVKTSNAIKSSVSGAKKGNAAKVTTLSFFLFSLFFFWSYYKFCF